MNKILGPTMCCWCSYYDRIIYEFMSSVVFNYTRERDKWPRRELTIKSKPSLLMSEIESGEHILIFKREGET